MNKAWIVIANASNATIYSASEQNLKFSLIKRLSHTTSRLMTKDLVTDAPGSYMKSRSNTKNNSSIHGSYAEPTDHKDLEFEHFAQEICQELERGRTHNEYLGLIIVAEPHFYGLINSTASSAVRAKIRHHVDRDYSYYAEKDLKAELEAELAHELRLIFIEPCVV